MIRCYDPWHALPVFDEAIKGILLPFKSFEKVELFLASFIEQEKDLQTIATWLSGGLGQIRIDFQRPYEARVRVVQYYCIWVDVVQKEERLEKARASGVLGKAPSVQARAWEDIVKMQEAKDCRVHTTAKETAREKLEGDQRMRTITEKAKAFELKRTSDVPPLLLLLLLL